MLTNPIIYYESILKFNSKRNEPIIKYYVGQEVNEDITHTIKPNELDHLIKIKLELKHIKGDGHIIDVNVNQGFVKRGLKDIVLMIESITQFKITPYDNQFFKKPASNDLISMMAQIAQIAADQNRGMFVIIREDYGMNEALPMPIALQAMKRLVSNDLNKHLLN